MTCSACASDVDGIEVSPIQQRAVLRDLRRALVDPEFDAVVLARATKNEQWMEGYESAVGCVDALVEHLTDHIEGLAEAVPPAPRAPAGRDAFNAVTDVWAQWCDDTSVHDCEMTDGERAGFRVAATHMRDPRVRDRLRNLARATAPAGPAASGDLSALREWLSGLDVEGQHSPSSAVLADIQTALAQRDRGLWVARQVPDLVYERDVAKNALRHLATPAAPTAATEGGGSDGQGEDPIYSVDQAWFRQVLATAGIESCVPISPDDIVMHFAGLEKRRVETQREADGIGRNLDREHARVRALRKVIADVAVALGEPIPPTAALNTPDQIEVVGDQLRTLAATPRPADEGAAGSGDEGPPELWWTPDHGVLLPVSAEGVNYGWYALDTLGPAKWLDDRPADAVRLTAAPTPSTAATEGEERCRRIGGLGRPDPDGTEDSWADTVDALAESAHGLIANVDGPAQGWTQSHAWVEAADRWCARYDRVIAAAPREGEAAAGERTVTGRAAVRTLDAAKFDAGVRTDRELADFIRTARAHRCAPPAPEVVSGVEAAALPDESLVVQCYPNGRPVIGAQVLRVSPWAAKVSDPGGRYVVLHRAAPTSPEAALAVGDEVTTAAELDRLPVGAVVAEFYGVVGQKRLDGVWQWTGRQNETESMRWPGVVRYLPEAGA